MGRSSFPVKHAVAQIFATTILLVFLISGAYAQKEKIDENENRRDLVGLDSAEIEQKIVDNAYAFFCDKIIDNDKLLREATIIFEGKTATAYSRVIYVASCAGDVDLVNNDIPNHKYINYLQEYYDELPPSFIKVSNRGKRTKKFVLLKKNKVVVNLYIYRPIEYRKAHYILFYILFGRDFKIFYGIRLDDDYSVIDYCTRNHSF